MPNFTHDGIVCNMVASKQHCSFGFWKGASILGKDGKRVDDAMGQFGRITSRKDLPSDRQLVAYIKKAVQLNAVGAKIAGKTRSRRATALRVPAYFMAAIRKDGRALTTFQSLSTSHRNEYVEWVMGAKQELTRLKRLATAVSWLKGGKNMN